MQTTRRVIRIHARRPAPLLTLAHAHTKIRPGHRTTLRVKLSARARRLLRQAARRHERVRFLLFTRVVNRGGQTVLAYKTITLAQRRKRRHATATTAAAAGAQTITSCNPVPGPGVPSGVLAGQAGALGAGTGSAAGALGGQTPGQLADTGGFTLASSPALSGGLPTAQPTPPSLDAGLIAASPSFGSGLPTFAPPPPNLPGSLAVGPSLSGGLAG